MAKFKQGDLVIADYPKFGLSVRAIVLKVLNDDQYLINAFVIGISDNRRLQETLTVPESALHAMTFTPPSNKGKNKKAGTDSNNEQT